MFLPPATRQFDEIKSLSVLEPLIGPAYSSQDSQNAANDVYAERLFKASRLPVPTFRRWPRHSSSPESVVALHILSLFRSQ